MGFKELKSQLDAYDNTDFYRMELTDLNMRMDPCWYGYNGMSTFSSMASEPLSNLQYNLGMFGNYINSYTYNMQTPIYNSMFSLKYIVNNTPEVKINSELFSELMTVGGYTAYKNNYNLPIAYCVDNNIINWQPTSDNPFENQNEYISNSTGVNDVLENLPINDIEYYNINDFGEELNNGKFVFYKTNSGSSSSSFVVNYVLEETQNVYVYVDSESVANDTITIRANGEFVSDQNIDEEYIFDAGVWKEGTVISVSIPIKDENASGYVDCFVTGLNMDKFKQAYNILNSSAMNVKEFKESDITGDINAQNDCVVYTSIPYDESWNIYVDGQELSSESIVKLGNSLLAFKLSKGQHTVELKYKAQGLTAGIIVSVVTALSLIAFAVISNKKKKKAILSSNLGTLIDDNSDSGEISVESVKSENLENQTIPKEENDSN